MSDPGVFNPYNYGEQEDEDERKPFGVDPDYRVATVHPAAGRLPGPGSSAAALEAAARGAGPPAVIERGPRYFSGHELAPNRLDPASIRELQADLVRAGLLTRFRAGIWDPASVKAYGTLLEMANQYGLTDEAMLAQLVAAGGPVDFGGGVSGAGGGAGLPQMVTTNRDDLRRLFRQTVIDRLGKGWTQEQIDELVDAYQWQEIRVQQQAAERSAMAREAQLSSLDPGRPGRHGRCGWGHVGAAVPGDVRRIRAATTGPGRLSGRAGDTGVHPGAHGHARRLGLMAEGNSEVLQALAQANHGLDLNGALRAASGLDLDGNGVAHALWGKELHDSYDEAFTLLGGV